MATAMWKFITTDRGGSLGRSCCYKHEILGVLVQTAIILNAGKSMDRVEGSATPMWIIAGFFVLDVAFSLLIMKQSHLLLAEYAERQHPRPGLVLRKLKPRDSGEDAS